MKPTYEELEAQVKQLAAENALLKAAVLNIQDKYMNWEGLSDAFEAAINTETLATDAYPESLRNEARAEGVEMFAAHCQKRHGEMMKTEPNEPVINQAITATRRAGQFALHFACQLREGKAGEDAQ